MEKHFKDRREHPALYGNMTTNKNVVDNFLLGVVKKSVAVTIFVSAVSAATACGFYGIAFHVALLPFWLALGMSVVAILAPGIIVLIDGGKSRLVALGFANAITLTLIYFFFGIVCFFFYFIFAPMPPYAHAVGLAFGTAITGYWMVFTARDVNKTLGASRFVEDAFEDAGSVFRYRLRNNAKLDRLLSSRSPSGKLHMYLVLLVAPVSLAIGRILAPVFGPHGPVLLVALILFPVSQWLAGIGVRQYIVMIRLPRMLERSHGKPVIVVSDDA